ncbi:hypothetical protein PF005_g8279 [Phytophthora fragariae]|uniref:Uncharacterized protein n=1 Tax=Phytophthora fragariae TaxID=53985 RepID=A0A6A4E2Z8_9STRA|nr:hypothetical protein PF003_g18669 [Phytophthora fragariae]KAE8941060.1 hypothetical protein PF009_g9141 [Phytophthora fragariae]KAE9001807.1 hypothetical protein PF011_g13584 [Phytophthora fragariae]KAE9119685.1 hypothetical protein PF007_g8456 [Phytophthora fragariae]KAE9119948.1 hypothetical protein PF010_g7674 [Phytophthora fragariae]
MSAVFPFVDPFICLENALRSVFHCRRNSQLAAVLTGLWEIWSLHLELHHRVLSTRSILLKIVVLRVLRAINDQAPTRNLPIHQLHTLVRLLHSLVSGSVLLQKFTRQLDAGGSSIERAQQRFSEFTSGWKLCAELCHLLSCSLTVWQELALDGYDVMARADSLCTLPISDDGTCSVVSVRTSHSVASSKYSIAESTARLEPKRAHYQSAIARDVIQEDESSPACEKFKLKTLEEHRYATRFQEKRVTLKTWRSALREAHKLIQSEDRVNLIDALYLLLEIIWLDPRGCNLATMYLDTGSIYLEFDHLAEAVKAYRNSIRLDPSNWKARYNLGVASARSQDFVEAMRQLKLALKTCPTDIAEEIASIFEEIDRIQCSKNLRAYHATKQDRTFTSQYLESLHFITGSCRRSEVPIAVALQGDHTLSHRNGLPVGSSTPQLLDVSREWQGPMALLLHRLYAFAQCRHVGVQDELRRVDPTRSGGVSLKAFAEVVTRITGAPLRATELKALVSMLGNEGSIVFHFLTPNAESVDIFDEMQSVGTCHAMLDLGLYRKRAKRSAKSRTGGLWFWFDITMAKWVEIVLPQLGQATGHADLALVDALRVHGWITPMDFGWKWKRMPEPGDLPMLQLADRGTFIYECHRVRSSIQEEARRTLQMLARHILMAVKRRKRSTLRSTLQLCSASGREHEFHLSEDVYTRLATDTFLDQHIAGEVLRCIEDMVDDLVMNARQEQKGDEDAMRLQDTPVRTEQRRKTISAVDVVT